MGCAKCGHQNPAGAKFCMQCGTPQTFTCAACQSSLPAGAAFCPSCGARQSAAPAPAPAAQPSLDDRLRRLVPPELLSKLTRAKSGGSQGERRTVTMLFCDVKGSTAAAEKMDPEEWAELMNGVFEHLIRPVYRYEGTLARLMGDAILAFFGAPIGHEDDPERAVRAALAILEDFQPYKARLKVERGLDLDVRVGINTGLVVVGEMGSDLRVEYTAMGDAVNLAARMEQTAAPGTVRISEETQKLVSKLFELEPLGGVEVKGKSEPVKAFRVVRTLARPASLRGIEGLHAKMVGRDQELARLREAFDTVAAGQGRIVSVQADAGIGKSRLVAELAERLQADGARARVDWFEGRSLSFQTHAPYAPVQGLLRSWLGILESDRAPDVWKKIEALTAELLPASAAQAAAFLGQLLGAELPPAAAARVQFLEPPQLREGVFKAFLELTAAQAARRPLVLVFEDLHWADSASIDLVLELCKRTLGSALLLLLVFRARRQEPSWRIHETAAKEHPERYLAIELEPLGPADARSLVSALLEIDQLPESVRALILQKAEGNPFFVEEVIRSLLDAKLVVREGDRWKATAEIKDVQVPGTLAAVINSRLDALDEGVRHVAQAASVVGREFRYDELSAVAEDVAGLDAALVELERRQLIREVAREPQRMFRFKHVLVREAAHDTLLLKRRRQLHLGLGTWLEKLKPERVEDIAAHFVEAKEGTRAVPHLLAAGARATRAFAVTEAIGFFSQAVELIGDQGDPVQLKSALEGLGGARQLTFDLPGALAVFKRLSELGRARSAPALQISGMNKCAIIEGMFMGQMGPALSAIGQAEQLARKANDPGGLIEASMARCFLHSGNGEFEHVEPAMKLVASLGEQVGDPMVTAFGLTHGANTLGLLARWDECIEASAKAVAYCEKVGNLKFLGELLVMPLPMAHEARGEDALAMQYLQRGLELNARIGNRVDESVACITLSNRALARGAFDEGFAWGRRGLEAGTAAGIPYIHALAQCHWGTCYAEVGGPMMADAFREHTHTVEVMQRPTGAAFSTWMWAAMGECARRGGKLENAEFAFHKALTERSMSMIVGRPQALSLAVAVLLARGKTAEAQAHCDELATFVTGHKMGHLLPLVAARKADVLSAQGQHVAALEQWAEADALYARAGHERRRVELGVARTRALIALGHAAEAKAMRLETQQRAEALAAAVKDEAIRAAFKASVEAELGAVA